MFLAHLMHQFLLPRLMPRRANGTGPDRIGSDRTPSQAAFKVLEKMGSVTHFSVANSFKRGAVVFFGAMAMGTPVALWPKIGAGLAVGGTAAYWVSQVCQVSAARIRPVPLVLSCLTYRSTTARVLLRFVTKLTLALALVIVF